MGSDTYAFGEVRVDVGAREVRRAGELQHLEPQAFDLLVTLIRQRDRVVPKPELLDEVWGDQFVSESALTTRIKELRRAVGDDGTRQQVVKNVRGRGYRFIGEIPDDGDRSTPSPGPPTVARHDPRTALRGRQEELNTVSGALAEYPLVTLVGPGGVGKSTLARAAAWAAGQQHEQGSAFVRLAAVTRDDEVVDAIRRAARVRDTSLDDDDSLAAIGGRDAVLVIDNCEHVIGEVARVARRLVDDGARCALLATSRERLGVPGEFVVQLEPLSHDDAAALFEERARAVRPDFRLTDHDPTAVDQLLDAVDRLPLGLEMAAGRLGGMTFDDLTALLSDHVDVLRSADRGADRHRSLGSVVEWSTDLLTAAEQVVLGDFSVFAGPVGVDDIEAVIEGPGGPAMPVIADLAERSLIAVSVDDRHGRYRMLSTVRSHAHHLRSAGSERRHAEFFADVAEQEAALLYTADELRADRRLDDIAMELRSAHRWARQEDPSLAARMSTALDYFSHTRLWGEPIRWTRELLPLLDDDDPFAPGAWALLAADAAHQGEYATARALASRVVEHGGMSVVSAHETLQDCALYEGRLDEAHAHSTAILEFGHEHGDEHAVVIGILGQGLAMAYRGDREEAVELFRRQISVGVAPTHHAWLRFGLGEALAEEDPARAVEHLEQALSIADSVSNHFVAGVAGIAASSVRGRLGDPEQALPGFLPVFKSFRRNGNRSHTVTGLRNLVCTLAAAERDEMAMLILGGLQADARRVPYGEERDRLDAARQGAVGRAGRDAVEEWLDQGAEGGHAGALDAAVDCLEALNAGAC